VSPEERDREALRKRWPSAHARVAADKAVDALPEGAPMVRYIDTWIAAYRKAGGKEPRR
jgi:hypothetical protein